jgi:hypothetical protein
MMTSKANTDTSHSRANPDKEQHNQQFNNPHSVSPLLQRYKWLGDVFSMRHFQGIW